MAVIGERSRPERIARQPICSKLENEILTVRLTVTVYSTFV